MSQDTNVENLIINKLTKAQYESITTPDPTQLYFVTDEGESISTLDDVSLNNIANGQILKYNATTQKWENAEEAGLPTQTGNNGKFLTTNGTAASWATVDALPSQTSQSGKFLTTNGTAASWASISIPTITDTYSSTSSDGMSGKAVASALSNSGFITGITSSDVTTALGFTPYNSTNPNGYITGITSSDVTTALGYTPYSSTNPNGYQANVIETVKVNGTALAPSSKAVDITIPTKTSDLSNDSGFISGITSSDVTTALGYTPYNSSNPNGYTSNVGTVTSVNNVQPINGNVSITIPDTSNLADTDLTNVTDTGYIKMAGASMPSNTYVDLTLGASGSTYTAPADGWMTFRFEATAAGAWIFAEVTEMKITKQQSAYSANYQIGTTFPVLKGQTLKLLYSNINTTPLVFRFIYAVGSESEAS